MARHRLLRLYLDKGDGLHARELLEEMSRGLIKNEPSSVKTKSAIKDGSNKATKDESRLTVDERSCCCYNRAFIEHISLQLEEPGASESVRDEMLSRGKKLSQ